MTGQNERTPGVDLSTRTLATLDARVAIPGYDRSALGGGIVHIGVGGFHRAHQAVYLDELCRQGLTEWSITGAGVLPADAAMAAALQPQDHLYTLVTRDARATNVRVIGSIVDYVLASPSIDPLVARLAQPETRIVSLTITEGGYPVDEATGAFLAPPKDALPPAFEALARALRARRDAGLGGFTVLSCDNIMGNGDTARTATLGVCAMVEPGLEEWVGQNVAFPNGMVDRITPQTADADREFLATEYGLIDRWPVVAETFIQWVIEDDFPYGGRPTRTPASCSPMTSVHTRRSSCASSTPVTRPRRTWPRSWATSTSTRSWPTRCWRRTCSASTMTRRPHRCQRCPASTSRTTSGW